jgi:hypothetical protein
MRAPSTTRTAVLGVLAWLLAMGSIPARAAADPAAAAMLFEEAKALRDQGDWPAACAKFLASMKLDPAVGPLLNIARCHEREGRLASALED